MLPKGSALALGDGGGHGPSLWLENSFSNIYRSDFNLAFAIPVVPVVVDKVDSAVALVPAVPEVESGLVIGAVPIGVLSPVLAVPVPCVLQMQESLSMQSPAKKKKPVLVPTHMVAYEDMAVHIAGDALHEAVTYMYKMPYLVDADDAGGSLLTTCRRRATSCDLGEKTAKIKKATVLKGFMTR
jgi:hypothetical protein